MQQLRETLAAGLSRRRPSPFLPADIVSQILNFGSPAPIDVQVAGTDQHGQPRPMPTHCCSDARARSRHRRRAHAAIAPTIRSFNVDVDRTRVAQFGLTERDVTNSLLITLAGSSPDRAHLLAQPQERRLLSASSPRRRNIDVDIAVGPENLPVTAATAHRRRKCWAAVAHRSRRAAAQRGRHALQHPPGDRHLRHHARTAISARVAADIRRASSTSREASCRAARTITAARPGRDHEHRLLGSASAWLGAIVLIYLLIVVNFQSWLDPFVIITALPAALAGIVWMLFATGTTLSVPALTGAIMCMGVATANSHPGGQLRARAAGRHAAMPSRPRSKPASPASARC